MPKNSLLDDSTKTRVEQDDEQALTDAIKEANIKAGRILFEDPGGFTHEDVVGDYLKKVWEKSESLDDFKRTILKIPTLHLKNQKNDAVRKEKKMANGGKEAKVHLEKVEEFYPASLDSPEESLVEKEAAAKKTTFLDLVIGQTKLSKTKQKILEMIKQGLTNEQIAREIGTDTNTINARISDLTRDLRATIKQLSLKNPMEEE